MSEKLIEVNNLTKFFATKKGMLHAVDHVNFYIEKGETLGLVDFPHPDSPTIPMVLPSWIEKVTSSTAWFMPFGVRKYFFKCFTSIKLAIITSPFSSVAYTNPSEGVSEASAYFKQRHICPSAPI